MKTKTNVIGIKLDEDTYSRLFLLADSHGTTMATIIRSALMLCMDQFEKNYKAVSRVIIEQLRSHAIAQCEKKMKKLQETQETQEKNDTPQEEQEKQPTSESIIDIINGGAE